MWTLFVFGSGSCGNCYYLKNDNEAILIDAGVGIRRIKRIITEYGIKMGIVKAILITHDHADHVKNVGVISKEYNLDVYATEKVHTGIENSYMIKQKIASNHKKTIAVEAPFQIESFEITPFALPHDASENMGYCIHCNNEIFSIMTDVGAVTDNVKRFIKISNYLVIEANYDPEMLRVGRYPDILKNRITSGTGHLSNFQAANALSECFHENLKNVWLCHLSEENNHPELAKKTIETHLRSYGIIAGKDFHLDVLRRKTPTGPFELKL